MPERCESNRAGYARSSRVEYPGGSSGPSCANCACGASGGGTAIRYFAAKFRWRKQVQPSATQKCPPSLRRRVQNALRAGIPPSGVASIACLKPNVLTLSGACQQALGAVAGVTNTAATAAVAPPAAEPAPLLVTPREELFMLRTACGADYANFCRGLRPGAGRITACLHYNSAIFHPAASRRLSRSERVAEAHSWRSCPLLASGECSLLAQSRHSRAADQCSLSGVKRTSLK